MDRFVFLGEVVDADVTREAGYLWKLPDGHPVELYIPARQVFPQVPGGIYFVAKFSPAEAGHWSVMTSWGQFFNPVLKALRTRETSAEMQQILSDSWPMFWQLYERMPQSADDDMCGAPQLVRYFDHEKGVEVAAVERWVNNVTPNTVDDIATSRPMLDALRSVLVSSWQLLLEATEGPASLPSLRDQIPASLREHLPREPSPRYGDAVRVAGAAAMSSLEAVAAIERQLGTTFSDLTRRALLQVLRNNLNSRDYRNLAELFGLGKQDQSVFPSTPAWIGITRVREGQLTVVLDHVVFFQREALRSTYKVLFAIAAKDVQVRFWNPTPAMGIGFTIQGRNDKIYRVYLDPPRGVNLTEVSAAVEQPGVNEVLDQVADLSGLTPLAGELVAGVGEAFSLGRSRHIARQHQLIWQSLFAKLASGQSAPFS
jgi:hypothetical protein